MAVPAALAGIHGAHQHEAAGQAQRSGGAGDGHFPVLQGLAQGLQGVPLELRQLIEEQHAVVGQGDLPRVGRSTAAGQGHGGHRVVGRAEGAVGQQGMAAVGQAGGGVDLRGLQRLLPGHVRQDGGQAAGQHGLARAGAADEQQVVAAGGGDLQGPAAIFLAHDVPQVRQALRLLPRLPGFGGRQGFLAPEMGHQLHHVLRAVDRQAVGQGGLGGVLFGDVEGFDAGAHGGQGHGEHAPHGAQRPRQRQLAQKGCVRRRRVQGLRSGQDTQENGQIVDRALLFLGGGGQVHGDAADGELRPAVFHRRPHPLPGLPHGGVGQAHHVEGRQAAGKKALHGHLVARDPREAQRTDGYDHNTRCPFPAARAAERRRGGRFVMVYCTTKAAAAQGSFARRRGAKKAIVFDMRTNFAPSDARGGKNWKYFEIGEIL